jgi:hypothetical protein
MLSPEEELDNSLKRSREDDQSFSNYEKRLKVLLGVEIAILAFFGLQVFTFYSLIDIWLDLRLYDTFFGFIEDKLSPFQALSYLRIALAANGIIAFILVKRTRTILKTTLHSHKGIMLLVIAQTVLLNVIPNLVFGALSITVFALLLSLNSKHNKT